MLVFVLGFGLVGLVLTVTGLISGLIERSPLSFPLLFLGLGLLLGDGAHGQARCVDGRLPGSADTGG